MSESDRRIHKVSTPEELIKLIEQNGQNWEAARRQLYNRSILAWLRATGYEKVAEEWDKIAETFKDDQDAGLEAFLQLLAKGVGIDLPKPQIFIQPDKVRVIGIQPGQRKSVSLVVSNPGRGHLKGLAEIKPPTEGITLTDGKITANRLLGKTTTFEVNVSADKVLAGSAQINITSNSGTTSIPVSFRSIFPAVLVSPWLWALVGAVMYYFALSGYLEPYISKNPALGFGTMLPLLAFTGLAIGAAGGFIASQKKGNNHFRILPNMMGGLIGCAAVIIYAAIYDGHIWDTVQLGYKSAESITSIIIAAIALWYLVRSAPFNGRVSSFVLSCIGVLAAGSISARKVLPVNADFVSSEIITMTGKTIPVLISAFIGWWFGQFILDRKNLPFLKGYSKAYHMLGSSLTLAILLALTLYGNSSLPAKSSQSVTVSVQEAAIYSYSNTNSKVLDQLGSGSILSVLGDDGNWYRVRYGNTGYIHNSQIKLEGDNKAQIITPQGSNFRSGPSMGSNILTVLPKGSQLIILERSGEWNKALYERSGYIQKSQVSIRKK